MRVVLKPAGLLLVCGVLVVLVTGYYARAKKAESSKSAEVKFDGFTSHKKRPADESKSLYDSAQKMTIVNLTDSGKHEWVHWGLNGPDSENRKATKVRQISPVKVVAVDKNNIPTGEGKALKDGERGPSRGFTWSDGAPTKTMKVTYEGIHASRGNGMVFVVPASTTEQTLTVYVGGYKALGTFEAVMSDKSPIRMDKVDDVALGSGYYSRAYRIHFQGKSNGQQLMVTWATGGEGEGNISLQAATL